MGLTRNDFYLTDDQIAMINKYFSEMGRIQFQAGEDPPGSIKIEFEWVPPLGRFVTAYFGGVVDGFAIESNQN